MPTLPSSPLQRPLGPACLGHSFAGTDGGLLSQVFPSVWGARGVLGLAAKCRCRGAGLSWGWSAAGSWTLVLEGPGHLGTALWPQGRGGRCPSIPAPLAPGLLAEPPSAPQAGRVLPERTSRPPVSAPLFLPGPASVGTWGPVSGTRSLCTAARRTEPPVPVCPPHTLLCGETQTTPSTWTLTVAPPPSPPPPSPSPSGPCLPRPNSNPEAPRRLPCGPGPAPSAPTPLPGQRTQGRAHRGACPLAHLPVRPRSG